MNDYEKQNYLKIGDKLALISIFMLSLLVLSFVAFFALKFLVGIINTSNITNDVFSTYISQYKIETFLLSIFIASIIFIICILTIIKVFCFILKEYIFDIKLKKIKSFLSTLSNFNSNELILEESSSGSPVSDLVLAKKGIFKAIAFDQKQKKFSLLANGEHKIITSNDIISFEVIEIEKRKGKIACVLIQIIINDISNPFFSLCITGESTNKGSDTHKNAIEKGMYWKAIISVLQHTN